MVKVEMPRGSWESVLAMLDLFRDSPAAVILYNEIEDQVYSQEY